MCLLNPSSVRSQTSKDESNCYVLTDKESMYSIIPRKDSQLCKRLCSEKLKTENLEFSRGKIRACRRVTVFRGFLPLYGIFKKKLIVYPSVTYLGLQTDKV